MDRIRHYTHEFENAKHELAHAWSRSKNLQFIFRKKSLDPERFESYYALKVIEYLIGVFKNENAIGSCPVMHAMLHDFGSSGISSEEIFYICSMLRRILINFTFEKGFATRQGVDELNTILDQNFGGIIRIYDKLLHEHARELVKQEKKFIEYTHAIDFSSIISKTDLNGKITYVNHAFEKISGYSKDELIGHTHNIVRHPDMDAAFFEELWKTIRSRKIFSGVIKNLHKNGSAYFVKSYIIPILDPDENISEYISIRQDITEIVQALEKETHLNDLKNDFMQNISHEIRTPLNAIVSMASLLKKKSENPKLQTYVTAIAEGAEQMEKVVAHILDLNQISNKSLQSQLIQGQIDTPLRQLLETYVQEAQKSEITFLYDIADTLKIPVYCDLPLIKKIIGNLVDNAIKFNHPEGKVAVKINYVDGMLTIDVKDNGLGIKESDIAHIFNSFYQIDGTTTRRHEGLGIGLALTKKIVETLHGDIAVSSDYGKGSLFSVKIPVKSS